MIISINLLYPFFDQKKSGELTSIMVNDVANMRVALGASFHKLFVEPINIIVLITILFIINIKLALYAVAIIPITSFIIIWIGKSIKGNQVERQKRLQE